MNATETPTTWTREHAGAYFSDCERYCIQDMRPACEVGPWVVTFDAKAKRAGFGRMIVKRAATLAEARADVAAHIAHGDDFWRHIDGGDSRTDHRDWELRQRWHACLVEDSKIRLAEAGIDLAELAGDEWLREDAVKALREIHLTERAAKRIVNELAEANR